MRTGRGTLETGVAVLDATARNTELATLTAPATPGTSEPRTIAFDADEYAARLSAVRRGMAARDLDALLLVDPRNVFYLTGAESQGAGHLQCLIVRPDQPLSLVTWNFEEDNAALTSGLADIVAYGWFD